jgi:hypothetical protein
VRKLGVSLWIPGQKYSDGAHDFKVEFVGLKQLVTGVCLGGLLKWPLDQGSHVVIHIPTDLLLLRVLPTHNTP